LILSLQIYCLVIRHHIGLKEYTDKTQMEGQINPDSSFGKAIINIASNDKYSTFLDVGTWNGMGTTKCLVNATINRPNIMIYSVEANTNMFNEALRNWSNLPSNLKLLHGRICNSMMSYDEIITSPKFKDIEQHFLLHYGQECYDFTNSPIVSLPEEIDVVILDGGEFCGQGDFLASLELNPKIIALDDTKCMKNNRNLDALLNDSKRWECLQISDDRNGWAIFKRRETFV